ncbi:hypothetical protein WJX73_008680 [Symbiochloris irregularis]|uniref:DUF4188 domain-containing protein n=1 Tax=Symbiochloris irregularis TaxID=706552 RepID=A0AAW1PUB8_9CHLO
MFSELWRNKPETFDVRKVDNDVARKAGALSAEMDGDFVVFLIGAGFNTWWGLPRILKMKAKMDAMLNQLSNLPSEETGFLGGMAWFGNPTLGVQYWRSHEHLHAFARNTQLPHSEAWQWFNRRVLESEKGLHDDGGVGIWHEAYMVKDGNYEAIYNLMPPFGLGRAGRLVPCQGKTVSAAGRVKDNQTRYTTAAAKCPMKT